MKCVNGIKAIVQSHSELSEPAVLATVIDTSGSTYRKAGARMLIQTDGVTGIVGGGCFDDDLIAQARGVQADSAPRTVVYDMTSPDDVLWGLGMGCNGAVTVFLQTVGPGPDQSPGMDPVPLISELIGSNQGGYVATVVESDSTQSPGHSWILGADQPLSARPCSGIQYADRERGIKLFVQHLQPAPRLGIFGAGADALPLAELAVQSGWQVDVWDHRPGYAKRSRFPVADRIDVFADELPAGISSCRALVVMSHSFEADRRFLETVAELPIPYIGVLGPRARRDMLLEQIGKGAESLRPRLRGPVGLDLGGELPEEIALAVMAEIQALHYAASGVPLSQPS